MCLRGVSISVTRFLAIMCGIKSKSAEHLSVISSDELYLSQQNYSNNCTSFSDAYLCTRSGDVPAQPQIWRGQYAPTYRSRGATSGRKAGGVPRRRQPKPTGPEIQRSPLAQWQVPRRRRNATPSADTAWRDNTDAQPDAAEQQRPPPARRAPTQHLQSTVSRKQSKDVPARGHQSPTLRSRAARGGEYCFVR